MTKQKAVRSMEELETAVRGLREAGSVQEENVSVELDAKVSSKDKREAGILYLEPVTRIPTGGKKHPEIEKQREYLYEWVKGIYENKIIGGEGIDFWLGVIPGDDYCRWKVPANRPVALPRFVAQHLSKGLQWKEPKPLAPTQEPRAYYDHEIMTPFEDVIIKKRGTFSPLNAY